MYCIYYVKLGTSLYTQGAVTQIPALFIILSMSVSFIFLYNIIMCNHNGHGSYVIMIHQVLVSRWQHLTAAHQLLRVVWMSTRGSTGVVVSVLFRPVPGSWSRTSESDAPTTPVFKALQTNGFICHV